MLFIDLLKPIYEEAFIAINEIVRADKVDQEFLRQFVSLRVKMELYSPKKTFRLFEQVFLAHITLNVTNNTLELNELCAEISNQASEILSLNPIILKDKIRMDLLIKNSAHN